MKKIITFLIFVLIVNIGFSANLKNAPDTVLQSSEVEIRCLRDTYSDEKPTGGTNGIQIGQSITVLYTGTLEKIELTVWPEGSDPYLILREWHSDEYDSAFNGKIIATSDIATNKPAKENWQEMSTFYFSSNPELRSGAKYLIEVVGGIPYVKIPGTYSGGKAFETANPTFECDMRFALYVCLPNKPVAKAGPGQTVNEGDLVILDGSSSFHPYDEEFSFLWIAPQGIQLSEKNVAQPYFTAHEVLYDREYIFTLIVDDGISKDTDHVVIVIADVLSCPIDAFNDEEITNATSGPRFGQSITVIRQGILDKIELTAWSHGYLYLILREWHSDDYSTCFDGQIVATSNTAVNIPSADRWQDMSTFIFPSRPELKSGEKYLIEVMNGIPYVKIPGSYSGGKAFETANPTAERDMRFALYICPKRNSPFADAGFNQTVIAGETVTLDGTGSFDQNADSLFYEWKAPEGFTLGSINESKCTFVAPEFNTDTTLIFSLIVTNKSGYSDISTVEITIKNSLNVGIHPVIARDLYVYPNPSDGIVHLKIQYFNTDTNFRILITNVVGEVVFDKQLYYSDNLRINLSGHPSGLYFIQLIDKGENRYTKLILN
jgi:hypothetical protein